MGDETKSLRLLAVAGIAALVSSCASSPSVQFYTLAPVAPQHAAAHVVGGPVQVAAVHVPAVLDRQEMVRETGSNRIEFSDRHRWGAPLGQMIRLVLTQNLDRRLPRGMIVFPHEPAPPETNTVDVDIVQFDSDASGSTELAASWSLLQAETGKVLVSRQVHLTERAESGSYGEQAEAMSRVLGRLADDIAAALAARTP